MDKEEWEKKGEGHRQRMREKFVEGGLARFSDEEVVEFLLTLGTPRKDVKIQAREAMRRFGNLSGVLSAPMSKLTKIKGIGQKNALYLNLIHQISGRYLRDRAKGETFFGSSKAIFDYLFHSMRDLKREVFKVLFLNLNADKLTAKIGASNAGSSRSHKWVQDRFTFRHLNAPLHKPY